jgi:glycosyltransferase involved in cell wall biosynthesis
MDRDRLDLLFLSPFPPSPPTFGAQRRVQGLMSALARRHEITAVAVVTTDYDAQVADRAMREYCDQVVLVPARAWDGPVKRLMQLRSLFAPESFVRSLYDLPALRKAVDGLLSGRRYDVVTVELPFLARARLARAPRGERPPRLVLDEHNLEFDLARQQARNEMGPARRVYNAINWRKIRREETEIWSRFDGVAFCSEADRSRAHALVPSMRSALVPNAVDVEYFRRRPSDPPGDGRTVMFFGALNYFPNEDGVLYFLREVWPLIEASHPEARLKIVGQQPTPEIAARRSPRIEVAGTVEDLRPHLAAAAVSIVPLRIGGGTRFKILESMAMERPVVSTTLGAEGIEAEPGRHLLLGDDAKAFAAAVGRILDDPQLGARLGKEGRALVEQSYSWDAAAQALEAFYREILAPAR